MVALVEEERVSRPGLHRSPDEDDHFIGLVMAMSYPDLQLVCEGWKARGFQEGVDFVLTDGTRGVLGPMPDWLQEDEGGTDAFSVPGTGAAPRSQPRPTPDELRTERQAAREQARRARVEEGRTRIELSDEVAARRRPGLAPETATDFLGECWALVHFIEGCRLGGAARSWVESTYPKKTWHIQVVNGYKDELRGGLTAHYRADDKDREVALQRVRRRAGEYIAALELGAKNGTVDLACFEEWMCRAGVVTHGEPNAGAVVERLPHR